jgi:hypothetical protein
VSDTPPALPSFTSWPTFPFEGDLHVKKLDDPVAEEPPRHGEDPAECRACQAPDEAYIGVSERWRVRSLDRPTGLPMVVILESRSHLDLGDLPNLLAAELGVLTVRLERAVRSLDGVARVHVNRWGDGSAHLHLWFMARPLGRLQLRGTFLSLWDEILPPIPESQWRENLALIAAWLEQFGGQALAEPPRIDWKAPAHLSDLSTGAEGTASGTTAATVGGGGANGGAGTGGGEPPATGGTGDVREGRGAAVDGAARADVSETTATDGERGRAGHGAQDERRGRGGRGAGGDEDGRADRESGAATVRPGSRYTGASAGPADAEAVGAVGASDRTAADAGDPARRAVDDAGAVRVEAGSAEGVVRVALVTGEGDARTADAGAEPSGTVDGDAGADARAGTEAAVAVDGEPVPAQPDGPGQSGRARRRQQRLRRR